MITGTACPGRREREDSDQLPIAVPSFTVTDRNRNGPVLKVWENTEETGPDMRQLGTGRMPRAKLRRKNEGLRPDSENTGEAPH
jgi:hypothetical protein